MPVHLHVEPQFIRQVLGILRNRASTEWKDSAAPEADQMMVVTWVTNRVAVAAFIDMQTIEQPCLVDSFSPANANSARVRCGAKAAFRFTWLALVAAQFAPTHGGPLIHAW